MESSQKPIQQLYTAMERRDSATLRRMLAMLGANFGVSPADRDWPDPSFAGSVCGLCATKNWLEGILVLEEFGVHPDFNRLTRSPLLEALYNRKPATIRRLLAMGASPNALVIDDRSHGISRTIPLTRISQFEEKLGPLDRAALEWGLSQESGGIQVRSSIARHLLNRPRDGDAQILTLLLEADWSIDEDARYYAQFFYFNCRLYALDRDADMVRELFHITPDRLAVGDRCFGFMGKFPNGEFRA